MHKLLDKINSQDIVDGVKLRASGDDDGKNIILEMIGLSPESLYVQDIDLHFNAKTVEIATYSGADCPEIKLPVNSFIAWAKAGIELAERIKGDEPR